MGPVVIQLFFIMGGIRKVYEPMVYTAKWLKIVKSQFSAERARGSAIGVLPKMAKSPLFLS
jgi:hypothetical protein